MFRRLLVGLILGLVVGGAVGAGLFAGLGVQTFSSDGGVWLAYPAAVVAGVLTGLVAGKPVWAAGAKIEAGLKAFFGALLAAGMMFALRQWGTPLEVPNWPAIGAHGLTPVSDLPVIALPLVAALLGAFFGLDNTGDEGSAADRGTPPANARSRVAAQAGGGKARVAAERELDGEGEVDAASKRARR
jgi:hypothetical protein